jgi:tyrocidine synthetase-3
MKEDTKQLNELIFDARERLKERGYWLNKLSGDLVKCCFPCDRRKKSPGQRSMETMNYTITGEVFSRLMHISNQSDIRLYIMLMAVLVLLLEKYTGNNDIIVGAPIYKQEVEEDFINKILALRNQLKDEMSFKELLLQVSQTNFEAVENINYPIETIPYELNMSFQEDEFPLFDIAILLENIHDKSYIEPLNLDVILSFLRTDEYIKGMVEYNADLYTRSTMERMVGHFMNLIQQALTDIDSKIPDISILSEDETRQLIFDFNDTRADYPGDKTIHRLFEEQVEKTPGNIAVISSKANLTYHRLNKKANQLAQVLRDRGVTAETIAAILLDRSIELIIVILALLKAGGAYLPIDIEYPADRINYLLEDSDTKLLLTRSDLADKLEFSGTKIHPGDETLYQGESLNPKPLNHSNNLAYVIYTSGTTGKPKGVMIEHKSLVNYVWWAAKTYVKNEKVNFPLYSSISFDLTVTSIFTPLVTGNTIVVYEGEERDFLIEKIIDENRVGVIKLTPSHLYVIKYKPMDQSKICGFIVGGEELETRIAREIDAKFAGNVGIYNEYGPTEATVGCVCYKFNPAEDNGQAVPIGVPTDNARIYVLDRNQKPVPKGVKGEIYISGDGVARGYLNRVELTAEKFIENGFYHGHRGRLYRSGDMAKWLADGNIEYLGRVDQQVKIRGYRIELGEIEHQLLQHDDIREAIVIARDGEEKSAEDEKGEPYLCAYFVSDRELRVSQLREYLLQHLPDYMIPLFFVQLEEMPLTSNGKVDRKALPEPGLNPEQEYAAPRNKTEEKLVKIWSQVLVIEKELIGIDTNFFELGGHSLKQVVLISKIHKELNVKIPLAEIFKTPSIRGLSTYIKDAVQEQHAPLEAAEKKEYYALALPQKRFYIFQQLEPESITYNISFVLILKGNLEKQRLEETFRNLIQRHESLRTSFELVNDEPVQKIHEYEQLDFAVEYDDAGPGDGGSASPAQERLGSFVRPFDLGKIPLMRVGVIHTAAAPSTHQGESLDSRYILIVDMHHIITDGISERILTGEFMELYAGNELSPLRLQYKDFSQWQTSEKQRAKIGKQGEFWIKQFQDGIPFLKLLTDFPRPAARSFEGSTVDFEISAEQTRALKDLALQEEASLYMVLLSIYYILLSKLSGKKDIIVGTGVVGRSHADLMNIIGLMFNTIPLRNQPLEEKSFIEFLKDLKLKTVEAFENQEYPFDELVEDLLKRQLLTRDASRNPLFDTMFAMQNFRENAESVPHREISGLELEPYEFSNKTSRFDLFFIGTEINYTIRMTVEYSTALFRQSTVEKIAQSYMEILSQILENKEIKLKNIIVSSSRQLVNVNLAVDDSENMEFGF